MIRSPEEGTVNRATESVASRGPSVRPPVLLSIERVRKYFVNTGVRLPFQRRRLPVRAVDDVSLQVRLGDNFGLVGESGSGKSTLAKVVMRLERPTDGRITFDGLDVVNMRGEQLRTFQRSTHIVFQDPNSSLSPRMKVSEVVGEPLEIQGVPSRERNERIAQALSLVGLNPNVVRRYPHEFSGGQRQRIAIARAIVGNPRLIVLDEPVSALDVSIRAQILNLLRDLQDRLGLTYLTIAHDLAVVYQACNVVGVMYLGWLVEVGDSEDLYADPLHPYTRILLSSAPIADPLQRNRERLQLQGEIPSPKAPPPGCVFHTRCPIAQPECSQERPEFREVRPGRWVACHLVD